ncbi:Zn-dependent peptidase ImmA (M78 family)/plasmid maintenance system antidote protein VapI [Ochrobactrum anthropi]|uniref:helix-turn-helix domain-containing protein n=1 Tax=Brucella anthropi TaxID=529 RepID=UPI0015F918AF|nr:XRE family transcriptional regulator [Brucella anthropi]MBA8861721.1 Zn-dependent peptidase ImmA (M78 family)/plasmid maintenance system antidote protein VapI [Brucella anthropi]
MFNIQRLELARKRRRFTSKLLAERAGIAPVTLSRVLNGKQDPDEDTIARLVKALDFPLEFFQKDDTDEVDAESASFRSLSAMTARERDAALSAGSLAFEVADWLNRNYQLPDPDLLDFDQDRDPASAARTLRQHWGLGEKPIGHLLNVLEAKGVRIFSLSEATKNVDAFSLWRNDEPFIFLNTFKSAERSRFDAAHELGHLVLHKHGGPAHRSAELEANAFASAFLMPEDDVRARIPFAATLQTIIEEKRRWRVSAAALCYRLNKLGIITEWQNRTFNIQLNQRYSKSEPNGIEREKSAIWKMVFDDLWSQRKSRSRIASDLNLPDSELENLVFGLAADPGTLAEAEGKRGLHLVK